MDWPTNTALPPRANVSSLIRFQGTFSCLSRSDPRVIPVRIRRICYIRNNDAGTAARKEERDVPLSEILHG